MLQFSPRQYGRTTTFIIEPNNRSMTEAKELEILESFRKKAEAGQVVVEIRIKASEDLLKCML
ncbi:hypothetical protein TAMA11512_15420 [Selenomonas sp. TAMA-11512]|nr:hypothetical protein TAMA11512_15420 [Selenomonas sp. TAMA-11512]